MQHQHACLFFACFYHTDKTQCQCHSTSASFLPRMAGLAPSFREYGRVTVLPHTEATPSWIWKWKLSQYVYIYIYIYVCLYVYSNIASTTIYMYRYATVANDGDVGRALCRCPSTIFRHMSKHQLKRHVPTPTIHTPKEGHTVCKPSLECSGSLAQWTHELTQASLQPPAYFHSNALEHDFVLISGACQSYALHTSTNWQTLEYLLPRQTRVMPRQAKVMPRYITVISQHTRAMPR